MWVEIVYRPVYDLFQFGYGGLSRSHGSTDSLDHVEHRVPSSLQTCTINQSPLMKWEKFLECMNWCKLIGRVRVRKNIYAESTLRRSFYIVLKVQATVVVQVVVNVHFTQTVTQRDC